jgi:hypothetical protein
MVPKTPSLWQLAGVEARAFRPRDRHQEGGNVPSRVAFRAAMLIALGAFDRRVHASGQAVCLLAPRWLRVLVLTGGAIVLAGVMSAVSPPLGWALIAVVLVVFVPVAVRAAIAFPATNRLRRMGPPGRRVYVHSVASTRPGAGAELLSSLAGEADQKGWLLVLDAANERLEGYYARFGFARSGAVSMPDGSRRVRMWRPPQDRGRWPS